MSYSTYHIYGYGIKISDLGRVRKQKVQNLIDLAPEFKKAANEFFMEEKLKPTIANYYEYAMENGHNGCCGCGLSEIISCAILENENLNLCACNDFDGEEYVVYEPSYPWRLSKKELGLTREKLEEIIQKYINILTCKKIEICGQSVENGG